MRVERSSNRGKSSTRHEREPAALLPSLTKACGENFRSVAAKCAYRTLRPCGPTSFAEDEKVVPICYDWRRVGDAPPVRVQMKKPYVEKEWACGGRRTPTWRKDSTPLSDTTSMRPLVPSCYRNRLSRLHSRVDVSPPSFSYLRQVPAKSRRTSVGSLTARRHSGCFAGARDRQSRRGAASWRIRLSIECSDAPTIIADRGRRLRCTEAWWL